jgi:hypothetical protein
MGDSTAVASSASVYTTSVFWERLWRSSGINFVVFFIVAYVMSRYRRLKIEGGAVFCTLALADRSSDLLACFGE